MGQYDGLARDDLPHCASSYAGTLLSAPIVRTLYGGRWDAATPCSRSPFAVASITAITQTLSIMLLASREQRRCLISDAIVLAGTIASLIILLPSNIIFYLLGLVVTQIACATTMLIWLTAGEVLAWKLS